MERSQTNSPSMKPKARAKISPLRNDSWTAGQPGALTTIQPRATKKTTVLTSAIAVERSAPPSRARRAARPDRRCVVSPRSSGPPLRATRMELRGG